MEITTDTLFSVIGKLYVETTVLKEHNASLVSRIRRTEQERLVEEQPSGDDTNDGT